MAQKHPLEGAESERLAIGSAGSIASGKSTFLSALHGTLGYDRAGIKIEKESIRGKTNMERGIKGNKRMYEGFFRSNATINPDRLEIYGMTRDKIYGFDFFAPGGHHKAVKLDSDIDGILFFLDLNLALDLKSLDKSRTIDFGEGDWPLIIECRNVQQSIANLIYDAYNLEMWPSNYDGVVEQVKRECGISDESIKTLEGLAKILKKRVRKLPPFGSSLKDMDWNVRKLSLLYKGRELLGDVIKSIIDSYIYAAGISSQGRPVIGIGTHKNSIYGRLPKDGKELLQSVQRTCNRAIGLFEQYCRQVGIELEAVSLDLEDGIKKDMDWFFTDLIKEVPWRYTVNSKSGKERKLWEDQYRDVVNMKNNDVIEIAYRIMSEAMDYRGLDREDLRILTFSERKSDLTVPYKMKK